MRTNSQFLALALLVAGSFILTDCKKDKDALPFFLLGSNAESAPGSTVTEETSEGTTVTTTNGDVTGEEEFEFQTSETIDINVNVTDDDGPVPGATVIVNETETDETLYQGVTDEEGNVTGTIEVTPENETVTVIIQVGDESIEQEVSTDNLQEINREVVIDGSTGDSAIADADGDGISDSADHYPDDSTRATRVVVPSADGQVVAYEDLYPSPGDADFNDYVIKLNQELDLDSSGKVIRIRGTYRHIARGAGYKHTLHLTLPGSGTVTRKIYSSTGSLESEDNQSGNLTGIEILPRSDGTISQSNTGNGQTFQSGKYAEIEIVLNEAVSRSELGRAPFDLFIKVINTGKEVHFPGKYIEEDGSDTYMDSNGFPWALSVPKEWNWPYESRNIADGYPDFETWYLSMGQEKSDWYKRAQDSYVFPYVTNGALAAYIRAGIGNGSLLWSMLALGLAGLLGLFLYREKTHQR